MVALLAACGQRYSEPTTSPRPELKTPADSLAYRMVEAHGGFEAWRAAPYLRFDFGAESGGSERMIARHLWDRGTGRYRIEWSKGPDTTVTVLFNVNDRKGTAYINGRAVDSGSAALVEEAYRRHINDSYWLLAPLKVFDEGVIRGIAADSASAGLDVLTLSFEGVGLTPGDRYWLWIRKSDGMVEKWAYHLQDWGDRPASMDHFANYKEMPTPAGVVRLAERKERPGSRTMLTHHVGLPMEMPDAAFTDPNYELK